MTRRAESYLGGHTVIGRGSGWFSKTAPPSGRKRRNPELTAKRRFLDEVCRRIGCKRRTAEKVLRFYVRHRIWKTGKVAEAFLDPRILRMALAKIAKQERSDNDAFRAAGRGRQQGRLST